VLHPVLIISLLEVVTSMSTTRLLSVLSSVNGHLCLKKEVLELESLYQISVPNVSAITNADVLILLRNILELLAALLKEVLLSEDSSMTLHSLLHSHSNLSSGLSSLGESDSVKVRNGLLTSILRELLLSLTGLESLNCGVGSSSSEDNEIEERVGSKSVSTVD